MTVNLFGPEGPNFATVRPPRDPDASGGLDTWFKNCSAANAKDGTFATADFFNTLVGNMRYAIRNSGVAESFPVPDNLLYEAIRAIADAEIADLSPVLTASQGAHIVDGQIRFSIGEGVLATLADIDPAADLINVFDASTNLVKQSVLGKAVNAGLEVGAGLTLSFNDLTGKTSIGLGAGGAGSVWHFGDGAPSNALGNNGDYYARKDVPGVYLKVGGTWLPLISSSAIAGAWLFGAGAPSNALGNNGDYYGRTDAPGGIYVKLGGAWVSLTGSGGASSVPQLVGAVSVTGTGGAPGPGTVDRAIGGAMVLATSRFTFTTAQPDANYFISGTAVNADGSADHLYINMGTKTNAYFDVANLDGSYTHYSFLIWR